MIAMLLIAPSAGGASTALDINVTVAGTLGANGWYRGNVTVSWQVVGATWSHPDCNTKTLVADTAGTKLTCSAKNEIELSEITKSVTIKLDKTPPAATPVPDRLPDANGWYNRPLTVVFAGADATSGLAGCATTPYAGPDNPTASVAGSCSDNAGNASATSFSFKYDATPPTLFAVTTKRGNRSAEVSWRKSTDTNVVEVLRAPGRGSEGESLVYRGSETGFRDTGLAVGRKYEYRVIGFDEAMNRAENKLALIATGPLLSPAPGEQVTSPPTLVWTPVKKASYYNVQLIRGGRRVLSAWPVRPSFRLPRTWLYKGRRYRLRPGAYRWYVWPGFGRITAARYARQPLGSSTFVVTK